MKIKQKTRKERNWFLVFIASILLLLGLAVVVLSMANVSTFGWWSLLIGLSGLVTVAAATMSIVKDDPRWILLDLILPG